MNGENQKHAGGRPKAQNPLEHDCKCRFTKDQYDRLTAYCKRHGLKLAQAIRLAVLESVAADEQANGVE